MRQIAAGNRLRGPFAQANGVAQRLPDGAWTKVAFVPGPDDADGAMGATGAFLCAIPGIYNVSVGIIWAGAATPKAGNYINVELRRNGIPVVKIAEITLGADGPTSSLGAGPLRLNAGDILEVWAYSRPGLSIYDNSTFSLVRVAD